ncbi:MAG: YcxB family protein [Clostridia bacterium]|nr:YcxB family protein [Clostridia bacterium]
MIEVNAVFTKERVKQMSRNKTVGNYVFFPTLALALIAAGIAVLIEGGKNNVVIAILMFVFSPLCIVLGFWLTRSEQKNNIQSFGVDKGDVIMNYVFSGQAIAISRTALGKTDKETIYIKELYKVKRTKKAFMLYINKDELFYVPTDCFVKGTPDELFQLFYDSKIILDY